jgi:hypothetical protein
LSRPAIPLQISHPGYWFRKRVAFKLGVGVHAYVSDVRYETISHRAGRRLTEVPVGWI